MRLTVHSIERTGPDHCRVIFWDLNGEPVEAEFTVDRSTVVDLASPTPDVFLDCGGTAEEVRAVVTAVIAFCAATPWKPRPE